MDKAYRSILCILLFVTSCPGNAREQCSVLKARDEIGVDTVFSESLSIDQIENSQLTTVEIDGEKVSLPFGFINDQWVELKNKIQEGDCLIHFRSGEESWKKLHGREGYLLIRGQDVVGFILIKIS